MLRYSLGEGLSPSRRGFLAAASGATLCSLLPRGLLAQQSVTQLFQPATLDAFTRGALSEAQFRRRIGTTFWVEASDAVRTQLQLLTVTSRKAQTLSAGQSQEISNRLKTSYVQTRQLASFTAVFRLTGGEALAQDSYMVESPFLGRFVLFLSPGQAGSYAATFSQFQAESTE